MAMAEQHYDLAFSRALTIWASPEHCQVQTHTAAECRQRWDRVFSDYLRDWRPF